MTELVKNTNALWESITTNLIEKNITISTMESCTSGLIASLITNTPCASQIFKGSYVTYCNEAKIKQGVSAETIKTFGVYSQETAIEMAKACKKNYNTNIGIGVTGVLDRIDPNNVTITKNVYYAIVIDNRVICNSIIIPDDIVGRFERKLYVASAIGTTLSNFTK